MDRMLYCISLLLLSNLTRILLDFFYSTLPNEYFVNDFELYCNDPWKNTEVPKLKHFPCIGQLNAQTKCVLG